MAKDQYLNSITAKIETTAAATDVVEIITGVSPRSLNAWEVHEVLIQFEPAGNTFTSYVSMDKTGDSTDALPSFDDNPVFMLGMRQVLVTSGAAGQVPLVWQPIEPLIVAARKLYLKHTCETANVTVYVEIRYREVKIRSQDVIELWESNTPQVVEG